MIRLAWILVLAAALRGQTYDLLIKGGHVIDPAGGVDGVMDVAVQGNRVARVAPGISAPARKTIDATGLYVTPGLVDLHMHVFGYEGSILPDDAALVAGTTTIVDAGGSGWRTFDEFRRGVISHAKTRVLALVNIVGHGMVAKYESDPSDMDPRATADVIQKNRDIIVGIKTAHFGGTGWTAIDRAVEAGRLANVPVMVDDKIFTNTGRTSREKLLEHLRPGDMHTHVFNDRQLEVVDRVTGKVQPYIFEARKRGVLFDMGHGAGSFLWPVAEKAMAQGFAPDSVSTDLHAESVMMQQSDMPNCISKMMLLGMPLAEAIRRSTVNPAKAIHRFPELGTLAAGRAADIGVFALETGVFAFKDAWSVKRLGTRRLQCVYTVRDGAVVYDRGPQQVSSRGSEIYDLLIRNGHVIDPANHRDGRFDVAVNGKRIVRVGEALPAAHARIVVDAAHYYVVPGLIDIRTHLDGITPDHNLLSNGVTTAVGTAPHAKTRLLKADLTVEAGAFAKPRPRTELDAARNRGALFDLGQFRFAVAAPLIKGGFLPDVVSSGIDAETVRLADGSMMDTVSKLLNMGMTLQQVVERATVNPARAIRHPELGALREGGDADIALLAQESGKFSFRDVVGATLSGTQRVRCVLTVRDGAVAWDTDGLSVQDVTRAGPYSNFK